MYLGRISLPVFIATIIAALLFVVDSRVQATGTHFDVSFDSNGRLATDFGGADVGQAVAIQSNGKIVVAGYSGSSGGIIAVARYNPDGSLDPIFDNDGKVEIALAGGKANALVIQPDGRIVVVGTARNAMFSQPAMAVIRLNTNGSLDSNFGSGGMVLTDISAGATASFVGRAVALQPDNKIVAAGAFVQIDGTTSWGICRYNSNGSLDTSFNGDGKYSFAFTGPGTGSADAVAVTAAGRILVAGTANTKNGEDFALLALTPAGERDTTFVGDGLTIRDFSEGDDRPTDVKIKPNGWIVVAGQATVSGRKQFGLLQFSPTGVLIGSLGNNGRITTDVSFIGGSFITELAIQPDGKIVAAGESDAIGQNEGDFALVRYNADGSLDAGFGRAGTLRSDMNNSSDDSARAIAMQADGKLVVAGDGLNTAAGSTRNFTVARYLPNMTPDFDFDGDDRIDLSVVRGGQGNTWLLLRSTEGFMSTTFGLPTDRIIPADFDGDAVADIGVYRPSNGTWYWIRSASNTFTATQFGVAEDLPTPADYDGDGRADISVFRPSLGTWYRLNSGNGSLAQTQFGLSGDKPTLGDFDGDGRADLAVYRPSGGSWYRLNSSDDSFVGIAFGIATDIPAPGDFDGDDKTDVSVFRPSEGSWYRLNSSTGALVSVRFGANGDSPVVGDYDRDGRDDIALFRNSSGEWYRLNSSNGGFVGGHWGIAGDRPIPAAFQY
jgi:uncharacterized delta-60 repeat protein